MPNIDGPRACTKAELPEVIAMVNKAMRQGTDQSMLTDYPLLYLDKNLENIRILKIDGEAAAESTLLPRTVVMEDFRFRIGDISAVATASQHRMKGYGWRCQNSCVEVMNQIGCELSVLWTDVPTFPFYEKAGYQAVQSMGWVYSCLGQDAPLFQNHGEDVVQFDPTTNEHIDALRRMHERDLWCIAFPRGISFLVRPAQNEDARRLKWKYPDRLFDGEQFDQQARSCRGWWR